MNTPTEMNSTYFLVVGRRNWRAPLALGRSLPLESGQDFNFKIDIHWSNFWSQALWLHWPNFWSWALVMILVWCCWFKLKFLGINLDQNSLSWAKLYITSTINIWKKLLSTAIWADKNGLVSGKIVVFQVKTWDLKQYSNLDLYPEFIQFRM